MTRSLDRSWRASLLALLVSALWCSACDDSEVLPSPTQITLEIDSKDEALLAALTDLRVAVALREGAGWGVRRALTVPASGLPWPVDIPVTPRSSADASAQFEVVVQALAGAQVLAETRAITTFDRNQHRRLKLTLFRCPGHEQEPGYTCAEDGCQGELCQVCAADGRCVPVTTIDPEDLPIAPGADAGREDAGARDAGPGTEAGLDAASDASPPAAEAGADAGLDAQTPPETGVTTDAGVDSGANDAMDAAMDATSDAAGDAASDAAADARVDAASADASDGSNACQSGFKRCGSACIPVAQCCVDGDCAAGTLCRQGTCKSWCEEQTRPAAVLAADYQCLDFDRGLPPAATWARSAASQGSVALSTTRFQSAPSSLAVAAPSGDTSQTADMATLTWQAAGSLAASQVLVAFALSPTPHPTIVPEPLRASLVCVRNSQAETCLMYSFGDSIGTLNGPVDNYRGLFIHRLNFFGAFIPHDCVFNAPVSTLALMSNVWNSIVFSTGRQTTEVWVNGSKADLADCGGGLAADTNTEIVIGLENSWGWSLGYDNVVVSVGR